jgi:hypothetical protein
MASGLARTHNNQLCDIETAPSEGIPFQEFVGVTLCCEEKEMLDEA